ncbi:hypothetical protein K439DRAFT_1016197 [Ramaria rubella]|nr:hypothetical protein K439DRAFT_1016197 [Ramaria rubella]
MQQFVAGFPDLSLGWVMLGAGLRKVQDRGAHRRGMYEPSTLQGELWKRAVWCLIVADRLTSVILGRPYCLRGKEIDLELPFEMNGNVGTAPMGRNGESVPLCEKSSLVTLISLLSML